MLRLLRKTSPLHAAFRAFSSTPRLPITFLTEDQKSLRESVRKYAQDVVSPLVEKMDEESKMDPSIITSLFEMGFMGIEIPEEYSGSNLTFTDSCLVIEEIARVDPAVAVMVDIHNTLINRALVTYGSEEQKKKYLPRLATESVSSFCLSESGSGSDAFSLQCKAEPIEDGKFRLRGNKMWISSSKEASIFLVFATEDLALKHRGITCFIVEKDDPGLTVHKKIDKLGIRASSTCEVEFDNVVLTKDRILGKRCEGYKVAIESLNEGRIGIAAQMLGICDASYNIALKYCKERKQFNKTLFEFQAVRHLLAELKTQLDMTRLLVYNAAALKEYCTENKNSGLSYTLEAAEAKLIASRNAEFISSKSLELLGGYGYTKEYKLEKFYRDSKIGSIYEGTSFMQMETIAKIIQSQQDD